MNAIVVRSFLYAPRDCWLALLCHGWRLPWIVQVDRGGWSVTMDRDDE
jgi:hypothetical protein